MVEEKRIPDGYKNTEVGIIPNDWDVINLGENSLIKARIGWQGLTVKEYKKNGDYYLITGTDFFNNKIKWNKCCFIDKKRYEQDRNIQLRNDDLLITKDGTIGKIAHIEELNKPATLNSGIFLVRSKEHIYEPVFLYHILRSFYFIKFLNQLSAGSTINHLYQKDIIKYNFILPKKEEQQAISIVLSDTDNLILSLEKLIDKKKLIKRGVMQELLTGEKRLDGFKEEWVKVKLRDICNVKGGKRLPKGEKLVNKDTGHPYIRVADMNIGGINTKSILFVPETAVNHIKNYKIYKNDLFISVAGTLGIVGCIPDELDGANLTENANKLCDIKCDKLFLMYMLLSDKIQNIISGISTIGAQPKLALTRIENFDICIPYSIEEQEAIARILLDMDKEIEALQKKLDKYKKIKEGMMEELLTGKRRLV